MHGAVVLLASRVAPRGVNEMGRLPMRVRIHDSAQLFLEATDEFRAATPAITSVIGSVAAGVAAGRAYERELWLTMEDSAGDVVGCAIRTIPFKLTVSDMPPEALPVLAAVLREVDPEPPGIAGPRAVVDELVAGLGLKSRARLHMEDVVRVLGQLVPLTCPLAGGARIAEAADTARMTTLLRAFADEAGLPMNDPQEVATRLIADSRLWVWCVDGEIVACAGHAPLATTPSGVVGRIGSVFTERPHRQRGYGSAITHHVAQHLQSMCSIVLLYADAANQTSNHVYESLGFERVAEVVEVVIQPAAVGSVEMLD